jgi:hypothetical protein
MFFDYVEMRRVFDSVRSQIPNPGKHRRMDDMYCLALVIIDHWLGSQWSDRHVVPDMRRKGYFHTSAEDIGKLARYVLRAIDFAEMLHNLDTTENFQSRLEVIRKANRDGVETGITELTAGKFFKLNGVPFRFVTESGNKQCDYDIEYRRVDGELGRCEAKCKLDQTAFSVNTIKNTLKEAKSQLPRGEGGIILLRVPHSWYSSNPQARDGEIDLAVSEFFAKEKTKRLASVFVVVSDFIGVDEPTCKHYLMMSEFRNPHCPTDAGLILRDPDEMMAAGNWTTLLREIEIMDQNYPA